MHLSAISMADILGVFIAYPLFCCQRISAPVIDIYVSLMNIIHCLLELISQKTANERPKTAYIHVSSKNGAAPCMSR
jgi:hypothetical protein